MHTVFCVHPYDVALLWEKIEAWRHERMQWWDEARKSGTFCPPESVGDQLVDDDLKVVGTRSATLTLVDLYDCTRITDVGVIGLSKDFPSLTDISLDSKYITDAGVVEMSKNCPKLTSITLRKGASTRASLY